VVIALACAGFRGISTSGDSRRHRRAIGLRVAMATVVTLLLEISYLKLIGTCCCCGSPSSLLAPQDEEAGRARSIGNLCKAIRTIVVADFVMSLDNVIGIAPLPRAVCCC